MFTKSVVSCYNERESCGYFVGHNKNGQYLPFRQTDRNFHAHYSTRGHSVNILLITSFHCTSKFYPTFFLHKNNRVESVIINFFTILLIIENWQTTHLMEELASWELAQLRTRVANYFPALGARFLPKKS